MCCYSVGVVDVMIIMLLVSSTLKCELNACNDEQGKSEAQQTSIFPSQSKRQQARATPLGRTQSTTTQHHPYRNLHVPCDNEQSDTQSRSCSNTATSLVTTVASASLAASERALSTVHKRSAIAIRNRYTPGQTHKHKPPSR